MSGESSVQGPARPSIPGPEAETERQIALLKAIIMIFREAPACDSEETMARICLKAAEELTGSGPNGVAPWAGKRASPQLWYDSYAILRNQTFEGKRHDYR